jgi:ApbE superfamily uncharacterized protein (UPF0280 family)
LKINGMIVVEFDGTRAFGTAETGSITIVAGGLQTIEIVYFDNGGGAALRMEHRVSGGTYANISEAITSTIGTTVTPSDDFFVYAGLRGTEGNDFYSG